jgi:hypothetical protein
MWQWINVILYQPTCMCTVLSLDEAEHNITRLTDYRSYYLLSDEETAAMIVLSTLLDPVTLNGVCIFNDEKACGNSQWINVILYQPTHFITHDLLDGHSYITDHHRFYCCNCGSTWIYFIELVAGKTRLNRQNRRYGAISNNHTHDDDGCCCCVIL